LRRLLRRAVSDGLTLGADGAFLHGLVGTIADVMKYQYRELPDRSENIARLIKAEEDHFRETLLVGGEMLEKLFEEMSARDTRIVSGRDVFRLYDTYGYPAEFVVENAAARGFEVDVAGFEQEMEAQRERARSASKMADDIFASARGPVHDLVSRIASTDFHGYGEGRIETRVAGIIKDGAVVEAAGEGEATLVVESTVFYAEAGGQLADTGVIRGDDFIFDVTDTQSREGLYLHTGKVTKGVAKTGAAVVAEIDAHRRHGLMANHTATHLLHHALRKRIGDHVEQAGSLVAPDRLRFDFTHFEAVRPEEIRDIERIVNGLIAENLSVSTQQTSLDEARREGVIALFGEKYGERVRVVRVGDVSAELCGGTHIDRLGSVGLFKIVGEESVARGVRRITAVTGAEALSEVHRTEDELKNVAAALDAPLSRVGERAGEVVRELKALRKELDAAAASRAGDAAKDLLSSARELSSMRVVVERLDGLSADDLRRCIDGLKAEKALVVVLASVADEKPLLIGSVSPDLVEKGVSAAEIVKTAAREIKGGGGGKPLMAQAGGKDPGGVDRALEAALEAARKADEAASGA
jgi:alanyl-tRNA synthetase